ncbi:tetratricopeptide repeat protein 7B [Ditylenchus destructor]|nr:tetratricopeptide repeat protein 7B [Ditylenchus destructor]
MNVKLKGGRLEAEIDKCRGECNWSRLRDLLPSIQSKSSGIDHIGSLIEGELFLEEFLENESESCFPQQRYTDFLCSTEALLQNAASINREESNIVMEACLLLAKLHFFCADSNKALQDIERSKIDAAKTQFITLRSLKLAAESYAIKGLSLEKQNGKSISHQRILSCFETSVELSISYISELQKTINSKIRGVTPQTVFGYATRNLKIGTLLEMALERAPYLSLRKSVSERRWDLEGIEWYRRIMTELSDKSMVEKVQQKLCRQLAEVLLRGMLESGYDFSSRAINLKSKSLSFYTGSHTNYFAPRSRFEEIILLLLISEIIASQMVRVSRGETLKPDGAEQVFEKHSDKTISFNNLKMVHNLLVLVLSNLRQYRLLASIYERSMDFATSDRQMWFQFGLSLICDNRFPRALKILEHCQTINADRNASKEDLILEHMFAARLQIEQIGDVNAALTAATKAVTLALDSWLAGRCYLLFAFALSMKAQSETCFEVRTSMINDSITSYEKAIELDPHDEIAHFFCALEYSLARNLAVAQERCQRSLEINYENPSAIMLMALLLTAKKDYKRALELVIKSLVDFPSHYGLLVLRLKLEAKYGLVEEALQTAKNLLNFWRKMSVHMDSMGEDDAGQENGYNSDTIHRTKPPPYTTKLNSKDALVPVTPLLTAPLGISTPSHMASLGASNLDLAETSSALGHGTSTNLSEYGGGASTISDSMFMSSSTKSWIGFSSFQIQANVWVELAEFFLEVDRASDIQACVEEVCTIYPNSHQALYMKGRLFFTRAEKCADNDPTTSKRLRAESKNCFLGALSIFPAHIASLTFLSKLYELEGNLKMAEKMIRDVISIDPLQYKSWHNLGRILAEQNRTDEANECFQTAGSLNFNTPLIPFHAISRTLKWPRNA